MNQSTDCWYCGVPFGGKSHPDVYACVKAVNEELYRTVLQVEELQKYRAEAPEALKTLARTIEDRDNDIRELVEALQHMKVCGGCAEDSWNLCEDGKKANALLDKATATQKPKGKPNCSHIIGGGVCVDCLGKAIAAAGPIDVWSAGARSSQGGGGASYIQKRICDHKIAPTFDGLGVRYKCQLCNEYVSE